jgi:catechol 2,3-dioxygenase-like lactoylglutathione lyase family enzyme
MSHQIQGFGHRQIEDREIHVRDALAAKEWYGEVLGVRTHRYAAGWKSFVLGDIDREQEFTLVQAAHQAGTCRLVWRFGTLEEFRLFYRRARAMGLAIKEVVDSRDALTVYLRDPDGNLVEVHCDAAGAAIVRTEAMRSGYALAPQPTRLPWHAAKFGQQGFAIYQQAVAA